MPVSLAHITARVQDGSTSFSQIYFCEFDRLNNSIVISYFLTSWLCEISISPSVSEWSNGSAGTRTTPVSWLWTSGQHSWHPSILLHLQRQERPMYCGSSLSNLQRLDPSVVWGCKASTHVQKQIDVPQLQELQRRRSFSFELFSPLFTCCDPSWL